MLRSTIKSLSFIFALSLTGAMTAQAGVIQLLNPTDLSPGFLTAPFPQPEGTILPTPYTLVTPVNVFTYSLDPGGEFLRGNINGTTFLYTGGLITGVFGPLTISAAVPLTEIMVGLLSNVMGGDTTFTFSVFDGASLLGTFSETGPYSTPLYAGALATGSSEITSLTITSSTVGSTVTDDFVVCNCGYANVVPEPGTLGQLGIGVVALALSRRFLRRGIFGSLSRPRIGNNQV